MNSPHYRITREPLDTHGAELISIYFRFGGNFFVFVYPKDGVSKYTLIDAGDVHHAGTLPSILAEIKIERKNIERVIITHSHPDHYGLAHLLVKGSQAKIMVHANFKRIVDAHKNSIERSWFGMYSTEELKKCNVEYLSPENGYGVIEIGGVKFPRLSLPIPIGDTGKLEVLAVPEVGETHTHDQVIALYSARDFAGSIAAPKGYRPSDDLLFSGDLWLMRGPRYDRKMKNPTFYMRRILYRIRTLLNGKGWHSVTSIEQDSAVKEALKGFFSIVRVKPGHGAEFIGSRILPLGIPADRDLFNTLGYSANPDGSPLNTAKPDDKLKTLLEQACSGFIKELAVWQKYGYTVEEISGFLVRIYNEQVGGSPAVAVDRVQRRERLKVTLARLQNDTAVTPELRKLAEMTLKKLATIS